MVYTTKDGKDAKVFPALEWLVAMCSHVPNRGEQMVRYYRWYSNLTRGERRKSAEDNAILHIIESDRSPAAYRIIKEMNLFPDGESDYRSSARESLRRILEDRMHDRIDRHLKGKAT